MHRRILLGAAVLVAALSLSACAATAAAGPAAAPSAPAAVATPQAAVHGATMPNLVGSGLQDAQDRLQALVGDPLFVTTSHDATGQRRTQVLDRNWKVCDQSVAPGEPITGDSRIDLGAVKLDEAC